MRRLASKLSVLFGVVFAASTLVPTQAMGATMWLSPTVSSYQTGETFLIEIRANTMGSTVNATVAELNYDNALLELQSVDTSSGAFEIEALETSGGGSVRLERGTTTPVNGSSVLVASLNFKARMLSGDAILSFTSASSLVDSSTFMDILSSTNGSTITIDEAPASQPDPEPDPEEPPESNNGGGGSQTQQPPESSGTNQTPVSTIDTTIEQEPVAEDADGEPIFDINEVELSETPESVPSVENQDSLSTSALVFLTIAGICFVAITVYLRHHEVHHSSEPLLRVNPKLIQEVKQRYDKRTLADIESSERGKKN